MPKSDNKIQQIKDFKKNIKEKIENLDSNDTKERQKTALELINRYKAIKESIKTDTVTINDLAHSLDEMQALVIDALEKSQKEWDMVASKSRLTRFTNWIKKAGRKIESILGSNSAFNASNIKKSFDILRQEKLLRAWVIRISGKTAIGLGGYGNNCEYTEDFTKGLAYRIKELRIKPFQSFFKNYAQRKITELDASKFLVTSALMKIVAGLAGISTNAKENFDDEQKSRYEAVNQNFGGGYVGLFMANLYNIIAIAVAISDRKSLLQDMNRPLKDLKQSAGDSFELISTHLAISKDGKVV